MIVKYIMGNEIVRVEVTVTKIDSKVRPVNYQDGLQVTGEPEIIDYTGCDRERAEELVRQANTLCGQSYRNWKQLGPSF